MTTEPTTAASARHTVGSLQLKIRNVIDSLSYLPTTAAVAVKFVELGKNPQAEPSDYAKVISADSSLSSKLLALSNSSWAGVRQKVTSVKMAVNLLGLGTVRTMAISYCMTGLHNELGLSSEESETFWEASLSKAVAAKRYAMLSDPKAGDEAFVAGLFQDFALTLMYSILRDRYLAVLQDPMGGYATLRSKERELFGTDHTEVGRALAQKLELPELFVDAIAFHHDHEKLSEFVECAPVRDATFVAGLFPHTLNGWNKDDAETCSAFMTEHGAPKEFEEYVSQVQQEFCEVYTFFNEGKTPNGSLDELLAATAREVADNTTMLVGRVNELLEEAAATGIVVSTQARRLEDEANCDTLTGVLNRHGFCERAQELLDKASRYGVGFGVCYVDVDNFKDVNDTHGHNFGDRALKAIVAEITAVVPDDVPVGRLGGDEFALLLHGIARPDAIDLVEQITANVAAKPVRDGERTAKITLSVGLLYVKATTQRQTLDVVLNAADKVMYTAKHNGGNQVEVRII
jgi:diguanylate cyclase (GGDEF)-like protein